METPYDNFYKVYSMKKLEKKLNDLSILTANIVDEDKKIGNTYMKLSDFKIIKIVGRGGFGKVFLV